jgi:outer membrane receptor protein involved in Fe transport
VFVNLGQTRQFFGTYTEQKRTAAAGFVDSEYDITDRVTLSAGIRYESESVDFLTTLLPNSPMPAGALGTSVAQGLPLTVLTDVKNAKRNYLSGGVGLDWTVSDSLLMNMRSTRLRTSASVSAATCRGTRAGGGSSCATTGSADRFASAGRTSRRTVGAAHA